MKEFLYANFGWYYSKPLLEDVIQIELLERGTADRGPDGTDPTTLDY